MSKIGDYVLRMEQQLASREYQELKQHALHLSNLQKQHQLLEQFKQRPPSRPVK